VDRWRRTFSGSVSRGVFGGREGFSMVKQAPVVEKRRAVVPLVRDGF
jgi:hypothetical protein